MQRRSENELEANKRLEERSREIHDLEKSLLELDGQIEEQIQRIDEAREQNESVRTEFASCLNEHLELKKSNAALEKEVQEKGTSYDDQISRLEAELQ